MHQLAEGRLLIAARGSDGSIVFSIVAVFVLVDTHVP